MFGSVQGCVSSDIILANLRRIKLPVLDRILQFVKALYGFIERVAGFNVRYEDLAQQIEVLQIQSLTIPRYDVLDGQDIQRVDI